MTCPECRVVHSITLCDLISPHESWSPLYLCWSLNRNVSWTSVFQDLTGKQTHCKWPPRESPHRWPPIRRWLPIAAIVFPCLFSRTFSPKEQCFSLTTNQRIVLFSFSAKRVLRKWEPHHRDDLDTVRSSEHGGAVFFLSCNNCCHVLITHVSCQTTIGRNLQRK